MTRTPKRFHEAVRDCIVRERRQHGREPNAISVIDDLLDCVAYEVDQTDDAQECVRRALHALRGLTYNMNDAVHRGNNAHQWTREMEIKDLRTQFLSRLEEMLDRECERLRKEPIECDPPPVCVPAPY